MAKPKNLTEFLERQDLKEIIYVGTEEGGGWLIIDTAENVIAELGNIDKKLRKYSEDLVQDYQVELDKIPTDIVSLQKAIAVAEKEGDVEALVINRRRLSLKEQRYVGAYNGRKRFKTTLDKWKSFGERKIISSYNHMSGEKGICVLISGFEKGDYWFKEEYDAAKNK